MMPEMQNNRMDAIGRCRSKMRTVVLAAAVIAACLATTVGAEEGWNLTVGTGVFGANVYTGSDEHYVAPMPTFKANYAKGRFSYVVSLTEGLSASYVNPDYGLIGSFSINAGEERKRTAYSVAGFNVKHSERTRIFLADSPNLSSPIMASAMLGYLTPVGIVGATAGYHPTKVESSQRGMEGKTEHGFLYSMLYMVELPLRDRLSVAGMFSLELMDQNYADTWYSVERETQAVDAFAADAGLRDIQIALQVNYDISQRVGMSIIGADTILLGGARKSPYTTEKIQRTMSLETYYRF